MWYVALQNNSGYEGPWEVPAQSRASFDVRSGTQVLVQLNSGYLQEGVFLPFLWIPLQHLVILVLRNIRTFFLIPVRICDLCLLPFILSLGASEKRLSPYSL